MNRSPTAGGPAAGADGSDASGSGGFLVDAIGPDLLLAVGSSGRLELAGTQEAVLRQVFRFPLLPRPEDAGRGAVAVHDRGMQDAEVGAARASRTLRIGRHGVDDRPALPVREGPPRPRAAAGEKRHVLGQEVGAVGLPELRPR